MFSVACSILVMDSLCNSPNGCDPRMYVALAFRYRPTVCQLPLREDHTCRSQPQRLLTTFITPPVSQTQTLMPAQTILSKEEKAKITSAIPKGSNKIWIASLARIYYAYPNPNEWSYAGLQGGLAFARDSRGTLQLKLVDLDGTRGVIWEHELYQNFDYFQDRPYFHSFPGDVRHSSLDLIDQN